jgi:drug/metabolite transporter (DMT)-like permease
MADDNIKTPSRVFTRQRSIAYGQALLAALLFGASAPLAKLLLGEIEPLPLSGLLYLGSGLSLLVVFMVRRMLRTSVPHEAPLSRPDYPWLAGAVVAGGVAAPLLLLYSLQSTPAATASLLLSFESAATTIIAALIFHEAVSRPAWLAIGLVTLASLLLSLSPGATWGLSLGAVGVLLATILWGLDNNLTRNISAKDPLAIVMIKGLAAGMISLSMAMLMGNTFPAALVVTGALLLGAFSYGFSVVLYVHALRQAGSARTSALFSTAPLAGILLSFAIFGVQPEPLFWLALVIMAAGALLLLREQHEHSHYHERVAHTHSHRHDDPHHLHADGGKEPQTAHSHVHQHESERHSHDHLPDIHHRHPHSESAPKQPRSE